VYVDTFREEDDAGDGEKKADSHECVEEEELETGSQKVVGIRKLFLLLFSVFESHNECDEEGKSTLSFSLTARSC